MRRQYEKWVVGGIVSLYLLALVVGGQPSATVSRSDSDLGASLSRGPALMVLSLHGVIQAQDPGLVLPSGVASLQRDLRVLADDKSVKAVVIRVNSPGGTVGSSQELFDSVQDYKKKTGVPVVVSIQDIGASGAYWVSLAADKIVAQPGSLVGSMGVITNKLDLTGVPEKYGLGMETYTAGEMKDMLNPWRRTSAKERDILKGMLDDLHGQFIAVLRQSRGMDELTARRLADGRVYTGAQAKNLGLVDALGGLDVAVKEASALAKLSDEPRVIYQQRAPFQQFLGAIRSQLSSQSFLMDSLFKDLGAYSADAELRSQWLGSQ